MALVWEYGATPERGGVAGPDVGHGAAAPGGHVRLHLALLLQRP